MIQLTAMPETTRDFQLDCGEELFSDSPDRKTALQVAIDSRRAQRKAIGLGPDAGDVQESTSEDQLSDSDEIEAGGGQLRR